MDDVRQGIESFLHREMKLVMRGAERIGNRARGGEIGRAFEADRERMQARPPGLALVVVFDSLRGEDRSMLVHDLRSSLATVNGYAELLRRQATRGQLQPTDIAQNLSHIQEAVATIERLLDQRCMIQSGSASRKYAT